MSYKPISDEEIRKLGIASAFIEPPEALDSYIRLLTQAKRANRLAAAAEEFERTLFHKIAHGDAEHRLWLSSAIHEFSKPLCEALRSFYGDEETKP